MKKSILIGVLTMLYYIGNSQERIFSKGDSFNLADDVAIEHEPNLYSSYFSELIIDTRWRFRTELQQSITSDFNYIEIPLLMRYGLSKNFSLFLGPKLNLLKSKDVAADAFSISTSFGLEYNVYENTSINARFNYLMSEQLENQPFNTNYQAGSRASFSLGSRFKF